MTVLKCITHAGIPYMSPILRLALVVFLAVPRFKGTEWVWKEI